MRSTYHIKVRDEELKVLEGTLKHLGVVTSTSITTVSSTGYVEYDYLVDLSKYELLYLRLTCKGQFLPVPKQQQQSMSAETILQQA